MNILLIQKSIKDILLKNKLLVRFAIAFVLSVLASIMVNDIDAVRNAFADSIITTYLLNITGTITLFFLDVFHYEYSVENILIKIAGTNGVLLVYGCLATRHMIIFIVFIFSYFGKIIDKIWFGILGLFALVIMNAFRIFLIAASQIQFPEYTHHIHYYFTRILMYGLLFLLWFLWIKKVTKN